MERLLEATYRAEQRHFWFRGFRRFVRPLLAQATRGLARPRLLDCGCGTGANLELLERFGRAFGFDLTWVGLAFAREAGRSRLARASVVAVPFRDASFDVVTSFDVLYALEEAEEHAAIAEMRRVLRPGGSVIINVAALDMLRGSHSILGGEVRRYTRGRLRVALERQGFSIARLTYTNAVLFPLVASLRLLQRIRGLPPADQAAGDFFLPPAPINAALSAALALEAQALGWFDMPIGSSVLCLAKKP